MLQPFLTVIPEKFFLFQLEACLFLFEVPFVARQRRKFNFINRNYFLILAD